MNATARKPRQATDDVPQNPQITPAVIQPQGGDFQAFVWQQLSELQRSVGAIQESQKHIIDKLGSMDAGNKSRLGEIDKDMSEVKKAFHAAKWVGYVLSGVVAIALTVASFIAKEAWDLAKPTLLQKLSPPAPAAQPAPPVKSR